MKFITYKKKKKCNDYFISLFMYNFLKDKAHRYTKALIGRVLGQEKRAHLEF